jgi:hypothetical protein
MPIHTLTVVPAPPPPPLHASIRASGNRLAHGTVSYQISCTTSCIGTTSYQVTLLRPHRKPTRAPELDLPSTSVSISAAVGGNQEIEHRYADRLLHTLQHILRSGDIAKLLIAVDVTGPDGKLVHEQKTVLLRRSKAYPDRL